MQHKLKAKVLSCGLVVNVYQAKPGDKYFIDEDNNPYTSEELDFNIEQEGVTHSDDPMIQITKFLEIPRQDKAPSFEEMNQSTLKLEEKRKEMEKELLRLNFKCQLVTTFLSRIDSISLTPALQESIMNMVEYFEHETFDNNDTD